MKRVRAGGKGRPSGRHGSKDCESSLDGSGGEGTRYGQREAAVVARSGKRREVDFEDV